MTGDLDRIVARVGIGLVAGAVGTAAMTVSQMIEVKVTGRERSEVPADAIDQLISIAPGDPDKRKRFSNLTHWGYGISLGVLRGVLSLRVFRRVFGATQFSTTAADLAFFGIVWTTPMFVLPSLGVTQPVTEWELKQVAVDFSHHAVYAAGVAVAWRFLTKDDPISR